MIDKLKETFLIKKNIRQHYREYALHRQIYSEVNDLQNDLSYKHYLIKLIKHYNALTPKNNKKTLEVYKCLALTTLLPNVGGRAKLIEFLLTQPEFFFSKSLADFKVIYPDNSYSFGYDYGKINWSFYKDAKIAIYKRNTKLIENAKRAGMNVIELETNIFTDSIRCNSLKEKGEIYLNELSKFIFTLATITFPVLESYLYFLLKKYNFPANKLLQEDCYKLSDNTHRFQNINNMKFLNTLTKSFFEISKNYNKQQNRNILSNFYKNYGDKCFFYTEYEATHDELIDALSEPSIKVFIDDFLTDYKKILMK